MVAEIDSLNVVSTVPVFINLTLLFTIVPLLAISVQCVHFNTLYLIAVEIQNAEL
jgi:hypothetical protein